MRWLILLMLLSGCAKFGQREASVEIHNAEGVRTGYVRVKSQHDGKLDYSDKDIKLTVDNRGKSSMLEGLLNFAILDRIKGKD